MSFKIIKCVKCVVFFLFDCMMYLMMMKSGEKKKTIFRSHIICIKLQLKSVLRHSRNIILQNPYSDKTLFTTRLRIIRSDRPFCWQRYFYFLPRAEAREEEKQRSTKKRICKCI